MAEEYGTCARCDQPATGRLRRRLCPPCYRKLYREDREQLESFASVRRTLPRDLRSRLLSQAIISPDGCWLWSGQVSEGYGRIHTVGSAKDRIALLAHRAVYELYYGPIPKGLHLDHLCRVRHCVNPAHLEPVTCQENVLRSPIAVASKWASRTHCEAGHEFTPENTRWRKRRDNPDKTYRECRACRRIQDHARRAAKRAAKKVDR